MMRRIGIAVVAVLIVGAYILGFWPEHRQQVALRAELANAQTQLAESQARVHLGEVLGRLLELSDSVAARDYGHAATLSSAFFDRVRTEAAATQKPDVRAILDQILETRDSVTTSLAHSDPEVVNVLNEHQRRLRNALGYPTANISAS